MIVKDIRKKELVQIQILRNFYQNKHMLLIGMGIREMKGKVNTAVDIRQAFNLKKEYAWRLLGELKKDGLIETGEKVQKEKVKICHHKLTPVAKKSLEILALWLHNFNNSGEPTNIIDPKYFRFFLADLDTLRAEKTEQELDLQEDSY